MIALLFVTSPSSRSSWRPKCRPPAPTAYARLATGAIVGGALRSAADRRRRALVCSALPQRRVQSSVVASSCTRCVCVPSVVGKDADAGVAAPAASGFASRAKREHVVGRHPTSLIVPLARPGSPGRCHSSRVASRLVGLKVVLRAGATHASGTKLDQDPLGRR